MTGGTCVGNFLLVSSYFRMFQIFSQQNKSMSEVIYPLFPKTQTPMPCTYPQTQFQPLSKSTIYPSVALLLPSLFLGAGTTLLTAGYSLLALSSFNLSHCTSQTNSSARIPHPRERYHTRFIRVHIILQMLEQLFFLVHPFLGHGVEFLSLLGIHSLFSVSQCGGGRGTALTCSSVGVTRIIMP